MTEKDGTTPAPKQDRVQHLIDLALELNEEVEGLAHASGKQFTSLAHASKINRRLSWVAIIGGIAQLGIILALVFVVVQLDVVTDRLDQTQTAQRQRALCPLYGILKGAESPEGKKRSAMPPDEYDHAFEVIKEGYAFLECDQFLKESGRDKW